MQIPSTLERFVPDIQNRLATYEGRLTFDDVLKWVLQFDQADQATAVKLFLGLKYFTSRNVADLCKILFSQLPSEVRANLATTRFVGLGGPADSGSMLAYHYRVTNDIAESSFVGMDRLHDQIDSLGGTPPSSIVFIDDFIGTGGQAAEVLARELSDILVRHDFKYVALHALVGFGEGVRHIERSAPVHVTVAHMLTSRDRVFHEASEIVSKDYYSRLRLRETLEQYGKRLYPRGPLGYGDSQALVAFFFNTPNNTLPVIWARADGWQPLLQRHNPAEVPDLTDNEKFALVEVLASGGRTSVGHAFGILDALSVAPDDVFGSLKRKHLVRVIDDDAEQFFELTAKGDRQAMALLSEDKETSQERLRRFTRQLGATLPQNPRRSPEEFEQLRTRRAEIVTAVSTACTIGELDTVARLGRIASWLLLMEHAHEERIRFGELLLQSFTREELGDQWAWIMVDDLGWSHVARGALERAERHLHAGIEEFWRRRDWAGVCQGWRHLQAIKARSGDLAGAQLGLRLTLGAACAIPDPADRLEMQAGVLRALAEVCRQRGLLTRATEYREMSAQLSVAAGNRVHAAVETRRLALESTVVPTPNAGASILLLVRHPTTRKNQKRLFGRHLHDALRAPGVMQISGVIGQIHATAGSLTARGVVYSSPAKGARTLAVHAGQHFNWPIGIDPDLLSVDAGELTGMSEEESSEVYPELMSSLQAYRCNDCDGFGIAFPEGESFGDVVMRVARFLLEKAYAGVFPDVCVVVGHASSLTSIINVFDALDRAPEDFSYRYHDVEPASITRLVIDAGSGSVTIAKPPPAENLEGQH